MKNLMVALTMLGVVVVAWSRRWVADDGAIYRRVASQMAAGNGPVFNAGERVEMFTSPLWQFFLGGIAATSVSFEQTTTLLSLAFLAMSVGLGMRVALKEEKLPLGMLLFCCTPFVWDYGTSGMETAFALCWIALCYYIVQRAESHRQILLAACVCGLSWLVRPELAIYGGLWFLALLRVQKGSFFSKSHVLYWVMLLAIPGTYQIWRMGYYGMVFANSVRAKTMIPGNWNQGVLYLVDALTYTDLWVTIGVAIAIVCYTNSKDVVFADHSKRFLYIATGLAIAIHLLVLVKSGGGYMRGRLVLPALLVACMHLQIGMHHVRYVRFALCGVLLFLVHSAHVDYQNRLISLWEEPPENSGIVDARRKCMYNCRSRDVVGTSCVGRSSLQDARLLSELSTTTTGFYIRDPHFGGEQLSTITSVPVSGYIGTSSVATNAGAIGRFSYLTGTDVYIVDMYGLGTLLSSHISPIIGGRPGHQRFLPMFWVWAAYIPEVHWPSELDVEQVHAARVVLESSEVRELHRAAQAPMSLHRFSRNLLYSWSNTRLEIPRYPGSTQFEFYQQ